MVRREVSVYCPSCGSENAEAANFCTSCGTALRAGDAQPPTDDVAATSVIPAVEDEDDDETTDADDDTGPVDATQVVDRVDRLRTCPNCSAPNASARTICGRCGADLDTGQVTKLPAVTYVPPGDDGDRDDDTAPRATQRSSEERRSRRTWLIAGAVVVIGGLLGVLAGMLVALRSGDDGSAATPDLPPPVFDQADYDTEPEQLSVARIGASSTNSVAGEEMSVARLVDGDLTTAWENDGAGNSGGVGEQVAIEFDQAVWIDAIVIGNGNQKDDGLYLGDARAKLVRVRFDGDEVVDVSLADIQGLQIVQLPSPVLTTGLQLQVQEIYEGDTYPELGLSEIRFVGWDAVGEDADIASERAIDRG